MSDRSPFSQSACCLTALALKMHSLHTVNLYKIAFTFFFFPKILVLRKCPQLQRGPTYKTHSQCTFLHTHDEVPHRNVYKYMQTCSNIVAFILKTIFWKQPLWGFIFMLYQVQYGIQKPATLKVLVRHQFHFFMSSYAHVLFSLRSLPWMLILTFHSLKKDQQYKQLLAGKSDDNKRQ